MRRITIILCSVIVLYLISLFAIWQAGNVLIRNKTLTVLRSAQLTFSDSTEDVLDSVMGYSALIMSKRLNVLSHPLTNEEMVKLSKEFLMDEVNVIGANGDVLATSERAVVGFNFNKSPSTKQFMKLLSPNYKKSFYSQPFRYSISNPNYYCKYFGVPLRNRNAILQIGITMTHYSRALRECEMEERSTTEAWRIGEYGHYEIYDSDGDKYSDLISSFPGEMPSGGILYTQERPQGFCYVLTFPYAGQLFSAVIPQKEFSDLARQLFPFAVCVITFLFGVLAFFMVKQSRISEKMVAYNKAEKVRISADLAMARAIQLSVLPHARIFMPEELSFSFEATTLPAREVGGDFFDFFTLEDGRVAFVIADVSGKGVPAAMFMALAKNEFYNALHFKNDLTDALVLTNQYLCEHNDAEMFVTLLAGVLDPKTGEVEWSNAGHNRPYLISDKVTRLDERGGRFLGMFPKVTWRTYKFQLKPGEKFFMYTDGVTEAMDANKKVYGEARLTEMLKVPNVKLCHNVEDNVINFVAGAEQSDDITMLCLTWYGAPKSQEKTLPTTMDSLKEAMSFLSDNIQLNDKKRISRLLNASDEMLSNIINYSESQTFTMRLEKSPQRLRLTLTDNGIEYNPLEHKDPDIHAALMDRPIGGLGILMAKKLVDSITYRRDNGLNVLTLVQFNSHEISV